MFFKFSSHIIKSLLAFFAFQVDLAASGEFYGEAKEASRTAMTPNPIEKNQVIIDECIAILEERKIGIQSLLTELMSESFSPEDFFIEKFPESGVAKTIQAFKMMLSICERDLAFAREMSEEERVMFEDGFDEDNIQERIMQNQEIIRESGQDGRVECVKIVRRRIEKYDDYLELLNGVTKSREISELEALYVMLQRDRKSYDEKTRATLGPLDDTTCLTNLIDRIKKVGISRTCNQFHKCFEFQHPEEGDDSTYTFSLGRLYDKKMTKYCTKRDREYENLFAVYGRAMDLYESGRFEEAKLREIVSLIQKYDSLEERFKGSIDAIAFFSELYSDVAQSNGHKNLAYFLKSVLSAAARIGDELESLYTDLAALTEAGLTVTKSFETLAAVPVPGSSALPSVEKVEMASSEPTTAETKKNNEFHLTRKRPFVEIGKELFPPPAAIKIRRTETKETSASSVIPLEITEIVLKAMSSDYDTMATILIKELGAEFSQNGNTHSFSFTSPILREKVNFVAHNPHGSQLKKGAAVAWRKTLKKTFVEAGMLLR